MDVLITLFSTTEQKSPLTYSNEHRRGDEFSAPPKRKRDYFNFIKTQGFTLIEILVVLVIIGIVIAAATLAINKLPRGQDARTTANILRSRFLTAEEQAVVQNVTLGFAINKEGYQFYQLETQADGKTNWKLLNSPTNFSFQKWPLFLQVQLDLPPNFNVLITDNLPPQPNIVFDSSGGVTPFILHLNKFTLQGSIDGTITLQ